MNLESHLTNRLCMFLNIHEMSCISDIQCKICANYRFLKIIDQDIEHNLIKNYCKTDKHLIDKISLKKITSKTQRIHVIGNHWPLINSLKHRKFSFFCKKNKTSEGYVGSICITDTNIPLNKINDKMIITQGYTKDYDLTSVDFLVIEKKYIDSSFEISFDKNKIPEKGFLVIDLCTNEKFYTE